MEIALDAHKHDGPGRSSVVGPCYAVAMSTLFAGTPHQHVRTPEAVQARAARVSAAVTGGEAPALERVDFPGIQVVICATKFDRVRSQPLEKNEAVARALRYIAHANGAHLLYSAGGGTASGRRDAEAADMQAKLRVLLAHAMFAGYDRRLCVPLL